MNTTSCNPQEPFIKLDEKGKASIINYNLPQSTCYRASSFLQLDLPRFVFNKAILPKDNFWNLADKLSKEEWIGKLRDQMDFAIADPIFENAALLKKSSIRNFGEFTRLPTINPGVKDEIDPVNIVKRISVKEASTEDAIAGVPISNIADKIKKGFKPVLKESLTGKAYIDYLARPKIFEPKIVIELRLKMCSFLGDYGAGRTVKTFSLLPGERTTISIKSWEENEESKKEASNVLDSLSESSANELQTIIESEETHSSESSETTTNEFGGGGGLNVGLNLGILKIGANGKAEGSKEKTFGSAVSEQVKNLVNSTSTHVSKSDALRQIEINSEHASTSSSGTENSTLRELENINQSRVLNFVFRQLLQEFFTITYLDDVSIIYSTGSPENRKVTSLSGLDDFLNDVIPQEKHRARVKGVILNRLCSIYDYQGSKQQFIECVEENLSCDLDCACLPPIESENYCYFRKRSDLKQSYNGKTVNGIILDTTHRIVRTSAVVVDALLGQGEALDCYNQQLQDADVLGLELENKKLQQAIDIINQLANPEQKARLYQSVFGNSISEQESEENV